MKVTPDLFFDDKGFIFDPNTGMTYSLNRSGAFIFKHLRQGVSVEELLQLVVSTFDVDLRTAKADIRDITQQFGVLGLVSGDDE
jgi:hypothetical protein